jgi:zinc transport system permease protein
MVTALGARWALFAVASDEDFARAAGLPTRALNIVLAAMAALTVTTAMRVVGLLLVSALMIVPVAISQTVCHSFTKTMASASILGVCVTAAGIGLTYWYDLPPGATIVVLAIALYSVVAVVHPVLQRHRAHKQPLAKETA